MKEIIPLKKDIIFKTKIGEITNISLDYDYKINDDLIEGSVDISGTYKMTEASVLDEDFFYSIPFSIAISKRIKKDTIKIEVDDFKYDFSKDVLKVSIELELTCDEEEIIEKREEDVIDNYFDDILPQEQIINEEETNIGNEIKTNIEDNVVDTNITNITNNLTNNDNKYYTYKIYIVRQGDNIETICNKYNVTLNDLKEYNNTDEINVGDKIIIPQINE